LALNSFFKWIPKFRCGPSNSTKDFFFSIKFHKDRIWLELRVYQEIKVYFQKSFEDQLPQRPWWPASKGNLLLETLIYEPFSWYHRRWLHLHFQLPTHGRIFYIGLNCSVNLNINRLSQRSCTWNQISRVSVESLKSLGNFICSICGKVIYP